MKNVKRKMEKKIIKKRGGGLRRGKAKEDEKKRHWTISGYIKGGNNA